MGKGWRWLLGAGAAVLLLGTPSPADAQVHIGVQIGSPPIYVGPYYDRYYYPPVRYRARPSRVVIYDRYDRRDYRRDVQRAQREYRREVREARREYQREIRDARRDRRR